MSARDKYHTVVRNALIEEGWTITHDPYLIPIGSRPAQIDLGAEMPLGAEKEGKRIAVEIKSFLGSSELYDLYNALGQFSVYRSVLAKREPERTLYLAVPDEIKDFLLEERDFRTVINEYQVRLVCYDPTEKEALTWIENLPIERL